MLRSICFELMRKSLVALDVLSVAIFVAIGRHVHDHGVSFRGVLSTSWPFLVGLGVGWLVLEKRRGSITSLPGGVLLWLSTVVLGMMLRVVAGQGTAFAFVLVALAFLGLFMLGWRIVLSRVRRVRAG